MSSAGAHDDQNDAGAGTGGGDRAPRNSAARLAAVQALYQIDVTDGDPARVVREFVAHRLDNVIDGEGAARPSEGRFTALVDGVVADRAEIDAALQSALPDTWPLQRLEAILRAILRAGVHELRARPDVPARVVISEYVDLAHAFYEGPESGMVNAVLDRLGREIRSGELMGSQGETSEMADGEGPASPE